MKLNILFAICCSAAMLGGVGCGSDGQMSVDGFYQARSGGLAGDECDDLLVAAAEADGEEQEGFKEMYRECVEEAIAERGGHAEANENDATCDIILDEIGDAIDRIRGQRDHNEPPNCDAPSSNGDAALCHLMDAYEVCQLDHDGDGDADVDVFPADACAEAGEALDSDEERQRFEDEHPECRAADGAESADEPDRTEQDPADDNGREGLGDAEAGEDSPEGDESTDGDEGGGTEGDVGAFCAELTEQIQNAETEQKRADLQETFERECTP